VRRLARFAWMFPFAQPARLRHQGGLLDAQGRAALARHAWLASIDSARAHRMPYEEARAHEALALRSPDAFERIEHRDAALSIYEKLGCTHHLWSLRSADHAARG
jgi:hypothetical protein